MDLFLGKNYIYQPQLNQLLNVKQELADRIGSIPALVSTLSAFLSHIDTLTTGRIDLVLDHSLSAPFSFSLPFLSKGNLNKIIEFELDQILLEGVEGCYYDTYVTSNREEGTTDVTGYLAEKESLDPVVNLIKEKGFEVRRVLSQPNLLDLQNGGSKPPNPHIYIKCNADAIRIFVSSGKLLKGFFAFPLKRKNYDRHQFEYILSEVVKVVDAICLETPEISTILLSSETKKVLAVDSENKLHFQKDLGEAIFSFRSINRPALVKTSIVNRPECLNLLKDDLYFIRELKKHTALLRYTAGILLGVVLLYSASVIYNSSQLITRQKALEAQLDQSIERYLPKGISRRNALYSLKEKLAPYRVDRTNQKLYEKRSYRVTSLLNQLTGLKKEIEGIKIRKLNVTQRSVSFQGELENSANYDVLSKKTSRLFPERQYRVRMNQKVRGNHSNFSISARAIDP